MAVFVLLSFIFGIFILTADVSNSGFCDILQQLSDNKFELLKDFTPEIDQDIYDILNICYNSVNQGNFYNVIEND